MIPATVNYFAVFIAAVASMFLGGLWYSPMLFGKLFMKESKRKEKDMKNAHPTKAYAITFLTTLITAYILAHFVDYVEATTVTSAFLLAFWVWLGFYATTATGSVLWENKSWSLYFLNVSYHLVALAIMAVILTLWV